jgi:hypothetical protein
MSINDAGVIQGEYVDSFGVANGFILTPDRDKGHGRDRDRDRNCDDGDITTFSEPHAGMKPGKGTMPLTNNSAGKITGLYIDSSGVLHGFVLIP